MSAQVQPEGLSGRPVPTLEGSPSPSSAEASTGAAPAAPEEVALLMLGDARAAHSRSAVPFSLPVFMEMLLVHCTYPFITPVMLVMRGPKLLRAMQLLPPPPVPYIPYPLVLFIWTYVTVYAPLTVVAMVALAIFDPAQPGTPEWLERPTLQIDIMHVLVAYFFHRTAVSLKYAYMKPERYERMMAGRATGTEANDEELLRGWSFPSLEFLRAEVRAVSASHGHLSAHAAMDPTHDQSAFTLTREDMAALTGGLCPTARAALAPAMEAAAEGAPTEGVRLSPEDLSTALVLQAVYLTQPLQGRLHKAALVLSILLSFLPTMLRAALGLSPFGSTLRGNLIIGLHLSNIITFYAMLSILFTGVLDHARRARALDLIGLLLTATPVPIAARAACSDVPVVSPSAVNGGEKEAAAAAAAGKDAAPDCAVPPAEPQVSPVPRSVLQISCFSSTRAFLQTRDLVLDVGPRFHERIVLLMSIAVVLFALIAAFCLFRMATAASNNVQAVWAYFVLMHGLCAPFFGIVGLGLWAASAVNKAGLRHTTLLMRTRLQVRVKERNAGGPNAGGLALLLADVSDAITLQMAEHPVRILGFEASPALTRSYVTAWLSLESAAIGILWTRLSFGGGEGA